MLSNPATFIRSSVWVDFIIQLVQIDHPYAVTSLYFWTAISNLHRVHRIYQIPRLPAKTQFCRANYTWRVYNNVLEPQKTLCVCVYCKITKISSSGQFKPFILFKSISSLFISNYNQLQPKQNFPPRQRMPNNIYYYLIKLIGCLL